MCTANLMGSANSRNSIIFPALFLPLSEAIETLVQLSTTFNSILLGEFKSRNDEDVEEFEKAIFGKGAKAPDFAVNVATFVKENNLAGISLDLYNPSGGKSRYAFGSYELFLKVYESHSRLPKIILFLTFCVSTFL